jgi:hypothetical protein
MPAVFRLFKKAVLKSRASADVALFSFYVPPIDLSLVSDCQRKTIPRRLPDFSSEPTADRISRDFHFAVMNPYIFLNYSHFGKQHPKD